MRHKERTERTSNTEAGFLQKYGSIERGLLRFFTKECKYSAKSGVFLTVNMFEEAKSMRAMLDMRGLTQSELAKFLGVSQPYVANKIRLLGFSSEMQKKISESGITERHARTLLRLPEGLRPIGLEKTVRGDMTVSECEIMVDCLLEEDGVKIVPRGINAAERIGRFETLLGNSISNLKLFGIAASFKREKFAGKTYITVCIED